MAQEGGSGIIPLDRGLTVGYGRGMTIKGTTNEHPALPSVY